MGNSVFGSFRFRAARPGRPEAAQFCGLSVEQSEIDAGEARDPVAGVGFGDADALAGQGLADEDLFATPLDAAVGADPAHRV